MMESLSLRGNMDNSDANVDVNIVRLSSNAEDRHGDYQIYTKLIRSIVRRFR
jgi:hypothetical protein